ncbi:MAG: alpha/beta hydrolase [Bacteriovoracaceae bacterium]|nr:alpha/beta hydrolase [Bacteriovoracaceae bacterium]
MKTLFILLLASLSGTLFAYEGAHSYCQKNPIEGISTLHQVNDSDFPNEKIYIHSYLKSKFEPNKKTVLFFSGGPGASPRSSEFKLDSVNVIFFEQRGMGCSRPNSADLFLNPKFYSSKKSINDAAKILSDYQINEAIIYGHSYGTILATMFAHYYPEKTERVIIEGVIGKADIGIWQSEHRREKLQETFESLDDTLKDKILLYSHHNDLPSTWFSVVGTMMSYLDNGYETYKGFLANILEMDESSFISFIKNFYTQKGFTATSLLEADDGDMTFGMITCQELSGTDKTSSMKLLFDADNKLQWDNINEDNRNYCLPLGISQSKALDLSNFPVLRPITYLIGEDDGATDLAQAKYHYQNVAKGISNFLVLKNGGHLPNLASLKDNRPCHDEDDCKNLQPLKAQVQFFEQVVLSKNHIAQKDIEIINTMIPLPWMLYE